jgi:hypothetical protein
MLGWTITLALVALMVVGVVGSRPAKIPASCHHA